MNYRMQVMIDSGECICVDKIGKDVSKQFGYTVFELDDEVLNYICYDFCIKETESWIWSIGKRYSDGKIFASTESIFYENPDFQCLWLR